MDVVGGEVDVDVPFSDATKSMVSEASTSSPSDTSCEEKIKGTGGYQNEGIS